MSLRLKSLFLVFGFLILLGLKASSVLAADKMYLRNPSQAITKSPGGGKIGELYINTPVKVLEVKDKWTQINVKAWVRTNALVDKSKKKKASAIGFDTGSLEILKYSTRLVREDVPSPRVYVTLRLRNNSDMPIYAWSGLLVAQSKGSDKFLFREPVSDDSKSILPGKEVDVNFYWEEDETPHKYLVSSKDGDLVFKLVKLKTKR